LLVVVVDDFDFDFLISLCFLSPEERKKPLSLSSLSSLRSPLSLVAPRPDVIRQGHQRRRGPRVERAQLRLRVRDQTRRHLPRFLQPKKRRVGGLLRRQIFPGGLAQHLGGLRDVEDVVDDLEGEADGAGVGSQGRDLGRGGAAEQGAGDDRGLEEGGLRGG